MNAPERHELLLLGERKKSISSSSFFFQDFILNFFFCFSLQIEYHEWFEDSSCCDLWNRAWRPHTWKPIENVISHQLQCALERTLHLNSIGTLGFFTVKKLFWIRLQSLGLFMKKSSRLWQINSIGSLGTFHWANISQNSFWKWPKTMEENHSFLEHMCDTLSLWPFAGFFFSSFSWNRHALKNKEVLFSGYKVPHPLEHRIVLRVQTTKDTTPIKAMLDVSDTLRSQLTLLQSKFQVRFWGEYYLVIQNPMIETFNKILWSHLLQDQVKNAKPGDVAMRYA